MPNQNYFLLLLIAIIVLKIFDRGRQYSDGENITKYRRKRNISSVYEKKQLLSKAEYYFWKRLKLKCNERNLLVNVKVRIEDFCTAKSKDNATRQRYRGYIKSRHIDFILCDSNLNMIAGIELDDKSHREKNAKFVDALKDDVFTAIGVPLFRIPAGKNYDEYIDNMLQQLFPDSDNENI